jgi:hypothetical protein
MLGDQVGMLAQAMAGIFDLDDDSMVKELVEQRGGDDRTAEDLAPLRLCRILCCAIHRQVFSIRRSIAAIAASSSE